MLAREINCQSRGKGWELIGGMMKGWRYEKNNNHAVHHVTVDENENGEIEGCQRVDKKFSDALMSRYDPYRLLLVTRVKPCEN